MSEKLRDFKIWDFERVVVDDIFNAVENMEGEVQKYLRKNRMIFKVFQRKNSETGEFSTCIRHHSEKIKEVI